MFHLPKIMSGTVLIFSVIAAVAAVVLRLLHTIKCLEVEQSLEHQLSVLS